MPVLKRRDPPVDPYRAALMAFLLSEDAGRLKRSALFCSLCSTKSFYQNTFCVTWVSHDDSWTLQCGAGLVVTESSDITTEVQINMLYVLHWQMREELFSPPSFQST